MLSLVVDAERVSLKMTKYRVWLDREGCIGAAACVAAFEMLWDIDDESKAKMIMENAKLLDNGNWEIEIDDELLDKAKDSAEVCPVNVIHIENLDTGERLI